ncbi:MAG: DNA translocase FtsK 4TM domain-containing protein [Flavobacteriales bacterium]|nr:DNA translocase FtsK 4TM domain-containing protein [Flavobacteriales bacterium]
MKKKFKLKQSKNNLLNKLKAPFLNKKNHFVVGGILLLFSFFLVIAFSSFFINWKADNSLVLDASFSDIITNDEIKNSLGGLGAYLSHTLIYRFFGISAYLIFTFTFFLSLRFFGFKRFSVLNNLFHTLLALIYIPVFIFHFYENALLAGGLGIYTQDFCLKALGDIGTSLLLITFLFIYLPLTLDIKAKDIMFYIKSTIEKIKSFKKAAPIINQNKTEESNNEITEKIIEDSNSESNTEEPITNIPIDTSNVTSEKEENTSSVEDQDNIAIEINSTENEEKLSEEEIKKKLNELGDFDPTLELSSYKMPTIDLLKDYGGSEIKINKDDLEDKKNRIIETLGHYKIGIASISATVGPTITLYEIVPEAGVRISKIKNLEDDIALSLSAEGIRIIAPIPGKGTIGIEVPNKTKNIVSMLEVLSSEKFQNSDMALPIAFGKTISNETYVVDLAKMPHLLMAGATGQGKSVGLNAVLASLLYKKHPSQVKFVLIDPKKVELTLFNKIERHYLAKLPDQEDAIITDTKKVVNTVNSLCIEMDERYELCKTANCRNITEYNKKFISRKLNPNKGHRFLPYIVLVIDEFADLIMTAGKEIETPIARLAQLARAIGIHLIVATQRPSVNVITGLIKANFPARVAFRVTSTTDSRTIMDSKGAEQLIGMGDMLISTGSELIRLQCAFIDTPEVEKICEFIGSQRAYHQAHMLPEYEGEGEAVATTADLNDKDALFDEAARTVVQSQSGSTSLIQRKLRLGYNRAGRIIDQLEAAGVVGPFEGSKARQVLVKDILQLEELLKNLNNE